MKPSFSINYLPYMEDTVRLYYMGLHETRYFIYGPYGREDE